MKNCEECDSKVVVIKELRKQNIVLRVENSNLEEVIKEITEIVENV